MDFGRALVANAARSNSLVLTRLPKGTRYALFPETRFTFFPELL